MTYETNQLYQRWELVSLENTNLSGITNKITIEFQQRQSRVAGISACNNYFGTYKIDKEKLSFSQMGVTQKFCGEAAMKIENAYLRMLSKADNYEISDDQFILYEGGEELARFDRVKG